MDVLAGSWRIYAHIDELEAQAQLLWLEILALVPEAHGSRALGVGDNHAAGCSFARGRAKVARLNRLCRRRFALQAATAIDFASGRVGTKFMPMDRLSRTRCVVGPLAVSGRCAHPCGTENAPEAHEQAADAPGLAATAACNMSAALG